METLASAQALTVRQPWASLIIEGTKDVENRVWNSRYRGPLVIHAAARYEAAADIWLIDNQLPLPDDAPTGVLLGIVDLIDVTTNHPSPWAEPEQWHWVLANPRPLRRLIPWRGQLGLFRVPALATV